ncbi:MAG: hypothetical protein WDN48_15775 [Pseudolabrys sp.]
MVAADAERYFVAADNRSEQFLPGLAACLAQGEGCRDYDRAQVARRMGVVLDANVKQDRVAEGRGPRGCLPAALGQADGAAALIVVFLSQRSSDFLHKLRLHGRQPDGDGIQQQRARLF